MSGKSIILVFSAHQPFLGVAEKDELGIENSYFESLSNIYLPLLRVFSNLEADGIPFKLALSISPQLCAKMESRVLSEKYVEFLEKRDRDPDICLAPVGWYKENVVVYRPRVHSPVMQRKIKAALEIILQKYPDVLTSNEAAKITGYHHETIVRWCSKKKLEYFCIRRAYLIPKISLMEYLTANRCRAINDTAKEHILNSASAAVQQFSTIDPT